MADSPRRRLAVEAIESFASWDIEKIMAWRADDCITTFLPRSLNKPEMNNTQYRAFFLATMPLIQNFTPRINAVVVDEQANAATVWCSSTADTVVGPYANEYMIMMHFNEAGDKVVRFLEFVDSAFSRDHFGRLRSFVDERRQRAGEQQQAADGGKAAKMS